MKKNNRQLAEAFNLIDTTWKKWSREFLDPDPKSGKGRGRTREYTAEEAFRVWLGGVILVNQKAMTFKESKEALDVIIPFMEKRGYLPIESFRQKRLYDGLKDRWTMLIVSTPDGPNYLVEHVIEKNLVDTYTTDDGLILHVWNQKYETMPLRDLNQAEYTIHTVEIPLETTIDEFLMTSKY